MSKGRRAQFVSRGELYLLAREWALPPGGVPGYERVELERARELLAGLPASMTRHPGLAPLLESSARRPLSSARAPMRGLVLLRRRPLRAGGDAPPEAEPLAPLEWQPLEPEPLPRPVVELGAQPTIAATLVLAAANGAPFCEMCERCS